MYHGVAIQDTTIKIDQQDKGLKMIKVQEKSIWVIKLSWKHWDWKFLAHKILARGIMKGCKKHIGSSANIPTK